MKNVEAAKQTIAKRLKLPTESVLAERNRDAVKILRAAGQHNDACLTALDRGDPQAAKLSVAESQHWIDEAQTIATRSLEVLDSLLPDVQSLETRVGSAESRLSKTQQLLIELQDRFAKSALMVEGARWGITPASSDGDSDDSMDSSESSISAADLFLLAKRHTEKSQDDATSAREHYAQGRLLAADESPVSYTHLTLPTICSV